MTRYTDGSKERVKDALDLVEIVSTRTDLRRVGGRFVGLCPFHEERTPSFSVSPEKGVYYCFGCQATGDGIRFVQETEALGFGEALEALAGRYNVELEPEHQDPREEERRRRRSRLESLLERTSRYYERFLWAGEEAAPAREYLASRGLEEPVLRAFRVGYAPSAFDRVARGALRDGFTLEELEAAGVARRGRTGTLVDRFRERIMFPLADARGRVLGFGARALRDGQAPKYLNTSENELYHKGRQLFGLDLARAPAARAGRVIVVEGYTDVLALHQAGIEEAVAVMGTAITPEQLAELSRAARTVFLALDADRAGQDAMLRAAAAAADRDVTLRVVGLPEGGDPADLVRTEGSERFRARLDGAVSVVEFQVARVLATADLGSLGGRDRALDALAPLLAAAPRGSITREELIRRAADRLDVPLELVVGRLRGGGPPGRAAPRPPGERSVPGGGPPPPGPGGPPPRAAAPRSRARRAGRGAVRGHVPRREATRARVPRTDRARPPVVRGPRPRGCPPPGSRGRPARRAGGRRPRARRGGGGGPGPLRVRALVRSGAADLLPAARAAPGRARAAPGERRPLLRARARALARPGGGAEGDRRTDARVGLSAGGAGDGIAGHPGRRVELERGRGRGRAEASRVNPSRRPRGRDEAHPCRYSPPSGPR